jgi:DNA-binding transcriptional MerR regulator
MPTDYTLSDLVKLTGVSARTVRYYIASGLLPPPTSAGAGARYGDAHLERLRVIKRLQAAHLPLAEIRRQLESMPESDVLSIAESTARAHESDGSALDYVRALLQRPAAPAPATAPAAMPSLSTAPVRPPAPPAPFSSQSAAQSAPVKSAEPDRAQWERISLDPDVELHIRRPLTRQHNKRVERLISIARQLLEED